MANTKEESAGTKAGAGARKDATKANGVVTQTESKTTAGKTTASSKQATPIQLTDRQREFLKKIQDSGEAGYEVGTKAEQRSIDALAERRLVKRGSKSKETGKQRYLLTKAAEKHLTAASLAPTAEPMPQAGPGSTAEQTPASPSA